MTPKIDFKNFTAEELKALAAVVSSPFVLQAQVDVVVAPWTTSSEEPDQLTAQIVASPTVISPH